MSAHQFELFRRPAQRTMEPAINVIPQHSSEGGRFGINAAAWRVLPAGVKGMRFYFSAPTRTIGLKVGDPSDPNTYRVTPHARGTGAVVSCGRFLDAIGWIAQDRVMLPVRWNSADQMIECEVPAHFLRDAKVHARPVMKALRAGGEGSGWVRRDAPVGGSLASRLIGGEGCSAFGALPGFCYFRPPSVC